MPQDSDLKARAVALHEVIAARGSSIFFPTGGVFLTISSEQMHQIKSGAGRDTATGQVTTEDLWHVYAEWHEAVHMSQLVTCPYVNSAAWYLLGLTRVAALKEAKPTPDGPSWRELGDDYKETIRKLKAPTRGETTAGHIFETHAVVQGLTWLTGSDRKDLRWLADHLYGEVAPSPQYVRLVDEVADRLGDEAAIALLPRLCFLALQTPAPQTWFMDLYSRLTAEGSTAGLAASSPREFCEWAGVDAFRVSRSLREREPSLDNHPCMPPFRRYFDLFEALPDVDARLDLLLSPHGMAARETFWPTFTVFADGHVTLARNTAFDDVDEEEKLFWISATADAIAGLELLERQARQS
jgi:hypothetical protein